MCGPFVIPPNSLQYSLHFTYTHNEGERKKLRIRRLGIPIKNHTIIRNYYL
jgi:hypothetical protein